MVDSQGIEEMDARPKQGWENRPRVSRLAIASLVLGVFAIGLYAIFILISLSKFLFPNVNVNFMADILGKYFETPFGVLHGLFGGAFFGLAGLITGVIASIRMKKSNPKLAGKGMIIIGFILDILAIAFNLVVWWFTINFD